MSTLTGTSRIGLTILMLLFLDCAVFSADEEPFRYESKAKRDPFVALVSEDGRLLVELSSTTGVSNMTLEGIVWHKEEEAVAVINGVIVKKGDIVDSFKVIEVGEKRVILLKDNQEFTIDLIPEE